MRKRSRSVSTAPHPLEPLAIALLQDSDELSVAELARVLGGRSAAYRKVATDVLIRMVARGLVEHFGNDTYGFRTRSKPSPALVEVPRCG